MKTRAIGKQSFLIYVLSLSILMISVLVSFMAHNWQWFARSGSLIVVLGIYLTSSQIIENSRRLRQGYRGAHREGNFQRDWAGEKCEQILRHARENEDDVWVMGKCGFNLLIAGTLIWGFGDLLGWLL